MDENRCNEIVLTLKSVLGVMDELEVKGKQNHAIVLACMNDIDRVINMLDGKEKEDAKLHPKP